MQDGGSGRRGRVAPPPRAAKRWSAGKSRGATWSCCRSNGNSELSALGATRPGDAYAGEERPMARTALPDGRRRRVPVAPVFQTGSALVANGATMTFSHDGNWLTVGSPRERQTFTDTGSPGPAPRVWRFRTSAASDTGSGRPRCGAGPSIPPVDGPAPRPAGLPATEIADRAGHEHMAETSAPFASGGHPRAWKNP